MHYRDPDRRPWSLARFVAMLTVAFGALVVALGASGIPLLIAGSDAPGCASMTQELLAGFGLAIGLVVGGSNLAAGVVYLRRPARGRIVILTVLALDALAATMFCVAAVVEGPAARLLPVWIPLWLASGGAFLVLYRAPRTVPGPRSSDPT